jgi:hypothetical protein
MNNGKHLSGAERFWYVLMNVAMGAGYFAKIPVRKAAAEYGMAELTSWERFWYVLECVALGAGYFAKVTAKVALTEAR